MGVEANTKNIAALMAHVEDMAAEIDALKGDLHKLSLAVMTIDGKTAALHNLVHAALVQTKGHGSTEPDNGD